ncbi:MAG: YraN family protein [Candidatus Gribaldobacteria bacterium]|nr:YraN family protein [Candidatus Gribaldobacteria bacterium]
MSKKPFLNPNSLGSLGEKSAEDYLKKKGYRIIEKNYQTKWGELDLITKKGKKIIFVEVKTIQQKQGFQPADQVNFQKGRQLLKMVQIYLAKKKLSFEADYQIDVVAIEVDTAWQVVSLLHLENALADFN